MKSMPYKLVKTDSFQRDLDTTVVIRNYIMIYQVDKDRKTVNILRFFHGKQDYEKLI